MMSEHPYISLSELNDRIRNVLERNFGVMGFWVVADVTNHSFKSQKNYHNFELVEKDELTQQLKARISCKAWGAGSLAIQKFERITGQTFTGNIQVLVNVSVKFHPLYGLQAEINDIDPSFTIGVLEQQRQDTLRRLVDENPGFISVVDGRYLTKNAGLPLPLVIQRIALISSSTSAGAEDFKHSLQRNSFDYRFQVDDYFATVQGEANAEQLVNALISIFHSTIAYDTVVIIRGGGAQTDFLIFDNYRVGRAIAKFPIPVLTGIGHQRNETIADLMAHTQTKTPTKVAEFLIAHNHAFENKLLAAQQSILVRTQQQFSSHSRKLSALNSLIVNESRDIISNRQASLVKLNQVITGNVQLILYRRKTSLFQTIALLLSQPKNILLNRRNSLANISTGLNAGNKRFVRSAKDKINHHAAIIRLMSPDSILKKGFAIVKRGDRILSNPDAVQAGDQLDIILSNTRIETTVNRKSDYDGKEFKL